MIENLYIIDSSEPIEAEKLLALQADLIALGFDNPTKPHTEDKTGWPVDRGDLWDSFDDDDLEKILSVFQLCSEFAGQWRPHTIINEEYFEDHCSQYAADQWNLRSSDTLWDCVDWGKWAALCSNDYKRVETEMGTTFMVSQN